MSGPFSRLSVLELGRFIAVPACAQLLAEGGADVIKIEDVEGDQSRHNGSILGIDGRQSINKNRGKRSLAARLADPEVLDAVRSLAARSDIVLANFRPGLAERLGLDYESVRRLNPRVIYAENTAYGTRGPLAAHPGMDIVIQAFTGLAHMGEHGPEQLLNPVIDYTAALLMAWGVSTALYHRERTGRGQKLDVALLHAAMFLENNPLTHVDVVDGWRDEFVAHIREAFAAGETWGDVMAHRTALLPNRVMRAYYGFFDTSDGTVAIACNPRPLRLRLLHLLGVRDRWTEEPGWEPDDVVAHEAAVLADVQRAFRERTTSYWVDALTRDGLPAGPMRLSDELFYDEHIAANGFLARVEHELLGSMTVVAPPLHLSDTPLEPRDPAPLGRDSRNVLLEAGLTDAAIDALVARGVVRDGAAAAAGALL
ncbi:CoA transferase [bacterium]|nr:CoA transferase [bacterium]